MASGGLLTKDDELEGVCFEIREAVSRFQQKFVEKDLDQKFPEDLNLKNLEVGPPIAKGCSAVVYAAKFKEGTSDSKPVKQVLPLILDDYNIDHLGSNSLPQFPSEDSSSDRLQDIRHSSRSSLSSLSSLSSTENILPVTEMDFEIEANTLKFPLALKIMFNYDIESNAMTILRAMHKETVPARCRNIGDATEWEKMLISETNLLPPHPNIVGIFGVFCDRIPKLRQASKLYPMALPPRLNPEGYGRNMSLFLLMKRYCSTLHEFLNQTVIGIRDRVLIFTQLLEAITHINRHGVAHRDIKSDNILLEFNQESVPVLVLSDFGCCIADKQHGLKIPYSSREINKGGNTALMAPEIISKAPGAFSVLDYSKSDLWACGTIAYEIFGQINPFYYGGAASLSMKNFALRNDSYTVEELPVMNEEVPFIVRKLVQNILQKNPRKRVSTDIAANIMQLFLWAPSYWLKIGKNPSNNEVYKIIF